MPVWIQEESEALKPWRTEAYYKYVGVRRGDGNEAIFLKPNRYYS
jgi:hypothetical protein